MKTEKGGGAVAESIETMSRQDVISMLQSSDRMDNVLAVSAALRDGYFDEEVSELVSGYVGSDVPVPFDRNLGDIADEYLAARG